MATKVPTTIRVSPEHIFAKRAFIRLSPAAKIKLCHLAGAPWNHKDPEAKLSDIQREVLHRPEREKIVHGGSRLGKSVLGGCELLLAAMRPYEKFAAVAARYDHVSHEWQYLDAGLRRLFAGMPQAFQRLVYRHSQNYHEYEVHTVWGSYGRGISVDSDDGAALLGQEFNLLVFGEGSHISNSILETKAMRAIDGVLMKNTTGVRRHTGYLSIYTTPKQVFGCSAAEWDRVLAAGDGKDLSCMNLGKVPFAQSVWLREASVLENPAYDEKVFEARKRTLSKAAFEEQYLGKMTYASGRVYAEFDEEKHLVERPPPEEIRLMRLGVGIDTGAFYGASLVGVDQERRVWVLGEVYTQKVAIGDSCEETRAMVTEILGPAFPESANVWDSLKERPDIWVVDPASQHKIEIMEALDITLQTPTRGQGKFDLIPTIDQLRAMMQAPRLFICDDLPWTIDQMRKYVWKAQRTFSEKQSGLIKEPRKEYDHLMDAMRFVAVPLEELGPRLELPPAATIAERWAAEQAEILRGPLRRHMARGAAMWGD